MQLAAGALEQWRAWAFRWLAWSSFGVISFVLLLRAPLELSGQAPVRTLYLVPSWVLVGVGTLARGLPTLARRGLVFGGMLIGLPTNWLTASFLVPNGYVAAAMLSLLGALFLPRWLAWSIWAGTVLASLLAGYLIVHGWPLSPGAIFDLRAPANWFRVLVLYAGMSGVTTFGLLRLMEQLRSARDRGRELLRALESESERRLLSLREQRSLESQLRESQRREALGALSGSIAHDFNNLLMVVINSSEELAGELCDPELQVAADSINAAGRRAAELTRELLLFSRARTGEPVHIDVDRALCATARLLERTLPASIKLEFDTAHALPAVEAPSACLEQILMNLCVNACDALPEGGVVRVQTAVCEACPPDGSAPQRYLCIAVRDEGIGMDQAVQARAFEPLFSTKDKERHAGLGLSVVKRLAEEAGGFVRLRSASGSGTVVEAFLPLSSPIALDDAPMHGGRGPDVGRSLLLGATPARTTDIGSEAKPPRPIRLH